MADIKHRQQKNDMINTDLIENTEHPVDEKKWVKSIVRRMMVAYDIEDHAGLAVKCGVHIKTPSNWIQRKQVPWPNIYHCHQQTGKSLDWLINGVTPQSPPTQLQCQKFASEASMLINSLSIMGFIVELRPNSYDALEKGLAKCFVDTLTPSEPQN